MDDKTEILQATSQDRKETWVTQVWEACGNRCSNCGSTHRLKFRMIVPEEAGGKPVVSNGTILCRTCEMSLRIQEQRPSPASGERTRPINFFVSQDLHAKLKNGLAERGGFRSVSSLVRFLMSAYVREVERYDDVNLYQDSGSDVKVNVWVEREMYDLFKVLVDRNGLTVTDALKGLIRMYEAEAVRMEGRTRG